MTALIPLSIEQVVAEDRAGPRRHARGRLVGAAGAIPMGITAVLGSPEDGTVAFAEVIAGLRKPRRGAVRWSGEQPHRSPALRRRLGVLLDEPRLPQAMTVRHAMRWMSALRPQAPAMLERFGLTSLLDRSIERLTYPEERSVELAIACASQAGWVLFEPFQDVLPQAAEAARTLLVERTSSLAVVVTSSARDAMVADRVFGLVRGVLVFAGEPGSPAAQDGTSRPFVGADRVLLEASVQRGARALVRALATGSSDLGLHAEIGASDAGTIRLRAPSARLASRALLQAAAESEAEVVSLHVIDPALVEVQAVLGTYRAPMPPPGLHHAVAPRQQGGGA